MATTYYTFDNVEVVLGLKVWTNDWEQGTITKIATVPADNGRDESDAWHEVTYANGGTTLSNRERISTRKPY